MMHPLPPINELPPFIRDALNEVQYSTQTHPAMALSAFLTAASVICQNHADVQLPHDATCPVSLNMIFVAITCDGKSTAVLPFMRPIEEFERKTKAEFDTAHAEWKGQYGLWALKLKGLEAAAQKALTRGQCAEVPLDRVRAHLQTEPAEPKLRRLLTKDPTPEAVTKLLQEGGGSLGVCSDDGGTVLGSRVMSSTPMLNTLWSGGDFVVDRVSGQSALLSGVRLTWSVAVQPGTLRDYLHHRGALLRDNGFLGRCLCCEPLSPQGYRQRYIGRIDTPAMDALSQRFEQLLAQTVNERQILRLSYPAKEYLVWLANTLEPNLRPGGMYADVRDAASRLVENIARIAALLHLVLGYEGEISQILVQQAAGLGFYYLGEFKRIFGVPAEVPQEIRDAQLMEQWIFEQCRRKPGVTQLLKGYLLTHGPNSLRKVERLEPALNVLASEGKLCKVFDGRKKAVALNCSYFYQVVGGV